MERGYAWKAEELHCGFALREDEPEVGVCLRYLFVWPTRFARYSTSVMRVQVWRGSKCDLAASCECHHFGGGWGLKDGNV